MTIRVSRRYAVAALMVLAAGTLSAHDFWLIPDAFQVASGQDLAIRGQTSSRFPTSEAAVVPERIAEARLVGATTDERLSDLSTSGRSLLIRHRPSGDGQRIVAVALVARSARTTPAQLQRYIALEGAPLLATRYEREGRYPRVDSLTRLSAKYAKTIVEVGTGGSRVFDRVVGHVLEIVPLSDPARLRAGDTLTVRVLYHGQPVPDAELHAGVAPPDTAGRPADIAAATGTDGIGRIPVASPGLWNVRLWHGAPAREPDWEVHAATLVFNVGGAARRP